MQGIDHSEYLTWEMYYMPPAQENESSLEFEARIHAAYWHRNQKRKYTGEPYIVHPAEVASIVRTVPHTEEMLAAAWLHDVVEDCGVTSAQVEAACDQDVAFLVQWLTDVSKPHDGNRAFRKGLDRCHSAESPGQAQTVKLADLISNSRSILAYDPNFAVRYLREKRALLTVMTKGDPTLWAEADRICREAGY